MTRNLKNEYERALDDAALTSSEEYDYKEWTSHLHNAINLAKDNSGEISPKEVIRNTLAFSKELIDALLRDVRMYGETECCDKFMTFNTSVNLKHVDMLHLDEMFSRNGIHIRISEFSQSDMKFTGKVSWRQK